MGELITGIVGIAGVLLGLFADRFLQRQGKVRCEIEPMKLSIIATDDNEDTVRALPVPRGMLNEEIADRNRGFGDPAARCFVEAKLFNEKEVKTGIRDLTVTFGKVERIYQKMLDRSTWQPATAGSRQMDYLEVVNLPSREWVSLSLMGNIEFCDAKKLECCDSAWLCGYFPDGAFFSAQIPFPS